MFTELKAVFDYQNSTDLQSQLPEDGSLNKRDFDDLVDVFPMPAFMSDEDAYGADGVLALTQFFYFFAMIKGKLNILRWGFGEDGDGAAASIAIHRDVMLADLVATYNPDGLQEPKLFDLFFSAWTAALSEEFSFSTETRPNEEGESLPLMLDIAQVYRSSRITHLGFSADFDNKKLIQHVGVFIPTNIDFYKSSASFEDASYIEFQELDRENVNYGTDEEMILDMIGEEVSPAMWAVGILAAN